MSVLLLLATVITMSEALQCSCNCQVVSRSQWHARTPKEIDYISTPVNMVFIHHTSMDSCFNLTSCIEEMQKIQDFHMDTRGWFDIGYNFLVGEDGRVYVGRSWNREGAHTLHFNRVAIAVSVMGDFMQRLPNNLALDAVKNILDYGVCLGKITPNYRLYGHRDVRETSCPGDKFYQLIQTWKHYSHTKPSPSSIIG
ncbi:peptidoglycan recognition protein 1-like [Octopus sinensis]|uniref:Peptidoglycan-recognition protein n=1 Tax=Octopus sinensis TaxID=2607531 RepID=A0A6P7T5B0_9MOLL|nr:peptidoglycan recognition protein 1-like [Octopus sinensis]